MYHNSTRTRWGKGFYNTILCGIESDRVSRVSRLRKISIHNTIAQATQTRYKEHAYPTLLIGLHILMKMVACLVLERQFLLVIPR